MPWEEIVKTALVGTERSQLSEESLEQLQALGIDVNANTSQVILKAAAVYSRMQKAGRFLPEWKKKLPKAAPKDKTPICNAKAIKYLSLMMNGTHEAALPEFMLHLVLHNKRLPIEKLPELFDRCKGQKNLWSILAPTIGKQGEWLIEQNQEWHHLLLQPKTDDWETSSNNERKSLIRFLRQTRPQKAIEHLQSTWSTENLPTKIAFLQTLHIGLSKKDEPFLETCLDDRRKDVRKLAASLLARIDDSDFVQRMLERVKNLMSVKKRADKKIKLEITLPENYDDAMIRDGIDPSLQWFKGGIRASRLGQMLVAIPPNKWNSFFKTSANDVVDIFVRSEWGELLVQAMMEATALHKDEEWMEVLLLFWIKNHNAQRWQNLKPDRLIDQLSPIVFNKVTIQGMTSNTGLLDEHAPITRLLKNSDHPWDEALTLLVLKNLKSWLSNEATRYWNGWHYRNILKKAAYRSTPTLYDLLNKNLPEESKIWSSWEREIEDFLNTLKFRQEMIKTISAKG